MNRDERLAENEAWFRRVNEGIDKATVGGTESVFCECANLACRWRLEIDPAEYRRVRRNERWFIVLPGHEAPEIETLVEEFGRFNVVAKRDHVAHVVQAA